MLALPTLRRTARPHTCSSWKDTPMAPSARTVVVTGASKGIGAATVRRLAGHGMRVVAGVRQEDDAAALKAELADRVVPVQLDVTDSEAIAAAVETVRGEVADAGLAGLVN